MSAHPHPIRVLLIDGRPVLLKGLQNLINAKRPRMEVCGQACTYAAGLDLADQLRPDVVFFSFFPDALEPLDVVAALSQREGTKVLLLKGLYEDAPVGRALAAGARGVVLAEDPTDAITRAILRVHHRDSGLDRAWTGGLSGYAAARPPASAAATNGDQQRIARLTQRERELIRAIVNDPSAKYMSIAARLGISEHTVHNHLSSIYQKLSLINRIDLLVFALRNSLAEDNVPPESTWIELD